MGFLKDAKAANAAHRITREGIAPRSLSEGAWPVVVRSCQLAGGHGFDLVAPSAYDLFFDEHDLVVALSSKPNVGVAALTYEEINAVEVGGRGARQKGGGFIGGGFGVEGAAEGMLAAGVLSALSSRTDIETVIRIQAVVGELIFFYDRETPDALGIRLSAVTGAVARRQPAGPAPSTAGGLAEQLAGLAALRDSGALTEEEFARAKERVLRVDS